MISHNTGNILLVSNYPSDTQYAWWLMERLWVAFGTLASEGARQAFLAYPSLRGVPESIRAAGICSVELSFPWRTPQERQQFIGFIRDRRIGTLYLTDQPFFSLHYALVRRAGIKKIVVHDHTPGDRPKAVGLRAAFKRARNGLQAFTADLFINVSPLMRLRSIDSGCIPAKRCVSVQNGIDPFTPNAGCRDMIRQSLGVGPNCVVIVSSGRAHPYKRFDFIVRAAAAMRGATDRDFVFFLIGDGHAIPELKAQIEALELNERVHLLGFRSDVRDILSAADISIHASLGEGFSLSIVEYMSAGLPVVVPDIPSVSQAIERGISGLIYARDSIEQAAECVLTLCSDVSMRTEMGKAAKKRADSLYTSDRTINEFRLALQSLLTSTPT